MPTSARLPTCISLILADHVYQVANSERLIIVGAFQGIAATAFPCIRPEIAFVFGLTDGQGAYDVSVTLEEADTGHAIAHTTQKLVLPSPVHLQDAWGTLNGVIFHRPGRYWAVLRANGQILMQRPFFLAALAPPTQPEG